MKKESDSRSPSGKIAFLAVFAAGLVVLALYLLKMDKITLTGTKYVDQEDALQMLLPEEDRRMSAVLYAMLFGPDRDLLFDSIRIRPSGFVSARISVEEDPADCLIHTDGGYAVINRNGVVVDIRKDVLEELTVLVGVNAENAVRYQPLQVDDETLFSEGLSLAKDIRSSGIPCETILLKPDDYQLVTGNITISFGGGENAEEKLAAILDLYPSLLGLKGTLHVEGHGGEDDNGKYYFEVTR